MCGSFRVFCDLTLGPSGEGSRQVSDLRHGSALPAPCFLCKHWVTMQTLPQLLTVHSWRKTQAPSESGEAAAPPCRAVSLGCGLHLPGPLPEGCTIRSPHSFPTTASEPCARKAPQSLGIHTGPGQIPEPPPVPLRPVGSSGLSFPFYNMEITVVFTSPGDRE